MPSSCGIGDGATAEATSVFEPELVSQAKFLCSAPAAPQSFQDRLNPPACADEDTSTSAVSGASSANGRVCIAGTPLRQCIPKTTRRGPVDPRLVALLWVLRD